MQYNAIEVICAFHTHAHAYSHTHTDRHTKKDMLAVDDTLN